MELNLSNNTIDNFDAKRITSIKEKFPKLERLILNHNLISAIPREISQLNDVKYLHLKNNSLTALPKEIFFLKNLKELYLTKNYLTALPSQIKNLKKLSHLNLRYNELTLLPKEFSELSNLTSLILTHNLIEEIPEDFVKLQNLRYLNIGYNPLKKLPTKLLESEKITIIYTSRIENKNKEDTIHFKPSKDLKDILKEYLQTFQDFLDLNYQGSSLSIEEFDKINRINIIGENSREIASSFEQFLNVFFEKELAETDDKSRFKVVKNFVVKLIIENKLDKALIILAAYFAENDDNDRFNQIVIISGELTRIKTYERAGTMTFEEGLRYKRIVSKNILDILDEIQ